MQPTFEPKRIVIAGDVTIDWNIAYFQSARDTTALWNASRAARACPQAGGAALVARLMSQAVAAANLASQVEIHTIPVPEEPVSPEDRCFNHAYSVWELLGEKDQKGWRVAQFLGIDRAEDQASRPGMAVDPESAHLIVLDDENLGFRTRPSLWPRALHSAASLPWIVLKLSYPIAGNELLQYLSAEWGNRLIVVVAANDLRLANAQINRGLSWERIAQDTFWEISYNPDLHVLSSCAHVIVSFQSDGAALISKTDEGRRCQLFFDPNQIENGWEAKYKGGMVGYNTCLAVSVARRLLAPEAEDKGGEPAVAQGIQAGMSAMRMLHAHGYENTGEQSGKASIAFPYRLVAADVEKPAFKFARSMILDPLGVISPASDSHGGLPSSGKFSILSQKCEDDLLSLARKVVTTGPEKALSDIPLGQFGKLLTVDRSEIESYRTISALIQEYICQEKAEKPVSIAVFGTPGSGKSFGIKEIANSLSSRIKEATFNLSQMNSPTDLIGALHQVRDEGLRGKIPLVFWDEFDSTLQVTPLGWLRYFLAPMQDGSFLEGQVTHPIGRAIFVFAGGTCERMKAFGTGLSEDPEENAKIFKAVKGPDFVSRLKGFIDILGPNPQQGVYDPYAVIRRAILLNSILRRAAPQFFTPALQIDENLLDAFLETRVYRYGVRSMESIISMSQVTGKTRYERSCLPPLPQLDLHVIGWEFMARVQKLKLEGDPLTKLSQAVHEDYCQYMAAQPVDTSQSEAGSLPNWQKSYDQLSQYEIEQNRQYALDIPNKLARAGYVMIHARTNEPPKIFPDSDLDILAEIEHVRWVKTLLARAENWQYGPSDRPNHIHACLLPWKQGMEDELSQIYSAVELSRMGRDALPENEKEKDRELIRRIPHILRRVGYTVIKVE